MHIENFMQDLRVGLRVLIKEKAFCALAVFVLAIGICAVTTQFAVVNGVMIRGFDFPESERLMDVTLADPVDFSPDDFNSRLTNADFVDLRAQQTSFDAFVGYLTGSTINLTNNGQPRRLQGGYVTHDFFRALGVSPVLGRDFLPTEDQPGVEKAIILSDALWHTDFGADPAVIGRAVRVNGRAGTVIGVMPPHFQFPINEQLWIPLNTEFPVRPRNDPAGNFISVIARLKPGVTREQAQAEVTGIAKQFAEAFPDTNKPFTLGHVRPLIRAFTGGQLSGILYTMLAFCGGVLVIACVNVMNMQFARATLRAKELAIRSSLGATRSRLIRQMLTESLLIAGLGAIVGVTLAFWSASYLDALVHNLPNPIPSWMTFEIDRRVLAVVLGATMLSALVSGFVPAWMSSRAKAIDALKEGGRGNTGRAIGLITRGLVIFQIITTCVLLIGAMLQLQSIVRQQQLDYGYDTDSVLSARMGLMAGDYPSNERRQLFYESLLRELRAEPQFESVALTNRLRMVFSGSSPVEIEGRSYQADRDRTTAQFENVSAGYFATLGIRVLEGRDFTDLDSDQREPVAIINAAFAQRHFSNESPLGRRIRTVQQNGANPGPWRTIIGVTSSVRMQGPFNNKDDGSGVFLPYFANAFGPASDAASSQQFGTAVVRPRAGQRPEALVQAVQAVVSKVDSNLPLYFVATPRTNIDSFLAQNRILASMFALFGGVAVILASVGLYGVMSFSVNQRTQEFGIRMALGAAPSMIMRMVLRQGTWQLVIGLTGGVLLCIAISLVGGDGLAEALFDTSPRDPLTYVAVTLLIALVSLAATWIPARRATRVDPMVALRAD